MKQPTLGKKIIYKLTTHEFNETTYTKRTTYSIELDMIVGKISYEEEEEGIF